MRLTESKLRQIIRKVISESPHRHQSRYDRNPSMYGIPGGYREYDRQRKFRAAEIEEEASQGEEEREMLNQLHTSLRKTYKQNPDQDVMSVVRSMLDNWDREFEDEIINYWTMLQS